MKKIICLILFLCFTAITLNAKDYIGRRLYMYGDSAISLGRGGTGVSSFGPDLFYLNPASVGNMERFGMGIQYGTLSAEYYNPDISFGIPTSYGVVGTSLRYYNLPHTDDFLHLGSAQIGGAKDFTDNLFIGGSINFVYANADDHLFYVGIGLGMIYKLKGSKHSRGLCVNNPAIGITVNAGVPIGNNTAIVNFNSFTIGYSFQFLRFDNFNLQFFNDFSIFKADKNSLFDTPIDFPVKFGLEGQIFDHYVIRAGCMYPNAFNYGIFTMGAGYIFNSSTFAGSINYSFSLYQKKDFIHYISLNFEYGTLDRTPPDISIKPDNTYISPNHDGTKDFVIFKTEVKDDSRIKGWRLQVLDSSSNVIKEFKMTERDINRSLTFTGFFKRISQKKESLMVPETIMWDGTSREGKTVPDGKYTYSFTAWDERENIAAQKHGTVFIDNTSPQVNVEANEALFSPNGDGKKDTFAIKQNIVTSPDDVWTASFNDASGKSVKTYTWTGDVPPMIIWDGKDDNGAQVPEGLYSYTISTTDKAGNSTKAEIKEIALTRQYETADISMSLEYFSFVKDSMINLFPQLTRTDGLEEWQIVITDAEKKPVNTLIYGPEFLRLVKWDCTNAKKKKLDDGIYYIKLLTRFKSGNTPESFERKLIIDSTPPILKISHKPGYFSPDSDGENDICTIISSAEDFTDIKKWTIHIFAPDGNIFKSYNGTAMVPAELNWDGVGANGEIVESAADYFIQLEATDLAGNNTKSDKDKLQIDILVVVTERGLKMRISNIEFAFDSALLTSNGKKILDRVYVILQKYERYDVVIEGHTDDIGREDYNLTLSENRAKAVQEYLVKQGITEERMKFIGKGETVSLYPNTNEENRRRNRRVEFLLIKKDTDTESQMPEIEETTPSASETQVKK